MKVLFKREKVIIVMKEKDVKILMVAIRYLVTFLIGLLGGANSDVVQSIMSL